MLSDPNEGETAALNRSFIVLYMLYESIIIIIIIILFI